MFKKLPEQVIQCSILTFFSPDEKVEVELALPKERGDGYWIYYFEKHFPGRQKQQGQTHEAAFKKACKEYCDELIELMDSNQEVILNQQNGPLSRYYFRNRLISWYFSDDKTIPFGYKIDVYAVFFDNLTNTINHKSLFQVNPNQCYQAWSKYLEMDRTRFEANRAFYTAAADRHWGTFWRNFLLYVSSIGFNTDENQLVPTVQELPQTILNKEKLLNELRFINRQNKHFFHNGALISIIFLLSFGSIVSALGAHFLISQIPSPIVGLFYLGVGLGCLFPGLYKLAQSCYYGQNKTEITDTDLSIMKIL